MSRCKLKKRKKLSFSQKLLMGIIIFTILVVVFIFIMVWRTGDMSVFAYLIPSIFAELAAATSFYYKKAEKENTKGGITYDLAMSEQSRGQADSNYEGGQ